MRIADNRKKLSRTLPTRTFEKATYANLHANDVGKPIPLAYGECYHYPVVCTNKAQAASTAFTFQICDVTEHTSGIESIDTVYIDGKSVTVKTKDTTTAQFILDVGVYSPTSAQSGAEVLCDFSGYLNGAGALDDNALDVVEDLMNTYLSIPYTTAYYDTTVWAASKGSALNVGFAIDKETKVIDIIEKIALSTFGSFIIKDDGLFTFKIFNSGTTATDTIYKEEYLEPPSIQFNDNEYLTSCSVGYKNNHAWYDNKDDESTIYQKYGKYQAKEFETFLTSTSEANSLSDSIMDYMQDIKGIANIKTSIQNITLDIGDVVNFELDRVNQDWMGETKVEIVDIQKNLLEGTVELAGRII